MRRVVVWGTGVVGRTVIAELVDHPAFELVGIGRSCDLPPGWVTALDLPLIPGVGTIR